MQCNTHSFDSERGGDCRPKIAACISAGLYKQSCSECRLDENKKTEWGCTGKARMWTPHGLAQIEVRGTIWRLWSCPVKFIPRNIIDFVQEVQYAERFRAVMPSWKDLGTRFREALSIYSSEVNEARSMHFNEMKNQHMPARKDHGRRRY